MKWFKKTKKADAMRIIAKFHSRFNNIFVLQMGRIREIWFKGAGERDFYLQSRIDLDRPLELELVYARMMMSALLLRPQPKRMLMIGLGAAAATNFLHERYPEADIDVVEIDRSVCEAARKYFFLKEDERYRVHVGDGRVFVKERVGKPTYDIIFLDAFKSGSVPFHLKTVEFYREIKSLLTSGGVVVSNLYGKSNALKPSDCKSFLKVFRHVYCFEDDDQVATVSLACDHDYEWGLSDFRVEAMRQEASFHFSMEAVANCYRPGKFKEGRGSREFTDDFAGEQFLQAVEHNNSNEVVHRPYPIKNTE